MPFPTLMSFYYLEQGSANFFCKGAGRKHFRLRGPYCLSHNYSALLLQCKHSHRIYANDCERLCAIKTLFTKVSGRQEFANCCSSLKLCSIAYNLISNYNFILLSTISPIKINNLLFPDSII